MLLSLLSPPPGPEPERKRALSQIASICGMALPDVHLRLSGLFPKILLSDADEGRVVDLEKRLCKMGLRAVSVDPSLIPSDDRRVLVRRLTLTEGGYLAHGPADSSASGPSPGRFSQVCLIQRGIRTAKRSETVTVTERKLSLSRIALTGGLLATKKVDSKVLQSSEERESFVLVQRLDGPELILYERQMDYRFLGTEMSPASSLNLQQSLSFFRLRRAKDPVDPRDPKDLVEERALRPGYVTSLPICAADPVDLAMHLLYKDRFFHEGGREEGKT